MVGFIQAPEFIKAQLDRARTLGVTLRKVSKVSRLSRSTIENGRDGKVSTQVGSLNQLAGAVELIERHGLATVMKYPPRTTELLAPETYRAAG